MKLIYLTSLFYPSSIANNRQTLSMAKEFSRLFGEDFIFVISYTNDEKLLAGINYQETKTSFLRKLHFVAIYYLFWLPFLIYKFKNENIALYFKDSVLASIAIFLRKLLNFKYKIVFESHLIFGNWRDRYIYKNADYILPIVGSLKKIISEKFNVSSDKMLVVPDGVDIALFDIPDRREEYREELDLPASVKIIGYIGSFSVFGQDKGVKNLILAFKKLKENSKNIFLLLVGGRGETPAYQKFAIENGLTISDDFMIEKYVDYSLIPEYQKACDVLISPFPFSRHFAYYMSPLKIFEYMASKRPIITSDLPSIREILTENEAVFFKPGNIADLSEKIRFVIDKPAAYQKLAENAFEKVRNYTWEKRAKNILEFIK